jgi:hypothetical protein
MSCGLIWHAVAGLFRWRAALQAEILVLRHQLNVLHRSSPRRVALSNVDRLVFVGLHRVAATVLDALKIVQPETVIRWHHAVFRAGRQSPYRAPSRKSTLARSVRSGTLAFWVHLSHMETLRRTPEARAQQQGADTGYRLGSGAGKVLISGADELPPPHDLDNAVGAEPMKRDGLLWLQRSTSGAIALTVSNPVRIRLNSSRNVVRTGRKC